MSGHIQLAVRSQASLGPDSGISLVTTSSRVPEIGNCSSIAFCPDIPGGVA